MVLGKRKRSWSSYGRSAMRVAKFGVGLYRSYTGNKRRRSGNRTNSTTQQHDTRLQYRYRRMPRYKRKQWSSFKRKVDHVINKATGSKQYVINEGGVADATIGTQGLLVGAIYGMSNVVATNFQFGMDDMNLLKTALAINKNDKLRFESAVLDITLTNMADDGEGNGCVEEVDVYEFEIRKRTEASSDFVTALAEAQTQTGIIGGNAVTLDKRGVTLFQFPYLIADEGIHIVSKRKYYVGSNQSINYQTRSPQNRTIDMSDVDGGGWSKPFVTKGVAIVHKCVPGFGATVQPKLAWGATRTYAFRQIESSVKSSGYE